MSEIYHSCHRNLRDKGTSTYPLQLVEFSPFHQSFHSLLLKKYLVTPSSLFRNAWIPRPYLFIQNSREQNWLSPYLLAMNLNARIPAVIWFPKNWREDFSTDRDFNENENETWVQKIRDLRTEYNVIDQNGGGDEDSDIGIVMLDHECTVRSQLVREMLSLYQNYHLTDLENGKGEAGHRRAAWLDDRNTRCPNDGKRARKYQNPLTATALFKSCQEKVEHRPEEPLLVTKVHSLTLRANSDLITKRCKMLTDASCKTKIPK